MNQEPSTPNCPSAGVSAGQASQASGSTRLRPAEYPAINGAVVLLFGIAALASVWFLARPLGLLLAGAVIAAAIAPLVKTLERRVPRLAAILVIYLMGLLLVAGLTTLAVPPLVGQARALFVGGPELIDGGRQWIDQHGALPLEVDQAAGFLSASVDRLSTWLISLPLAVLSAATEVLVVAIISMYWLVAAPSLHSFVLSLVKPAGHMRAEAVLQEICQTMGGYVRATVVDMLLLGVAVYVGLSLLGVRYALVLALIAGLSALVPIVGPILTTIPAIAVALVDSPLRAVAVLAFYVVLHNVESDILLPNLIKNQADIPPLLVLFALLAGGATGSILAVLIAIPIAGALRVLVLRVVAPAVRHWSGAAEEE